MQNVHVDAMSAYRADGAVITSLMSVLRSISVSLISTFHVIAKFGGFAVQLHIHYQKTFFSEFVKLTTQNALIFLLCYICSVYMAFVGKNNASDKSVGIRIW